MSIFDSKIGKIAAGFATGGPAGAAMALVSSGNSPAAKASSLFSAIKGITPASVSEGGNGAPGLMGRGSGDVQADAPGLLGRGDAASRRMSVMEQDPASTLNDGIAAMDHPDMIGKVHPQIAAALYGAKHFGGPHSAIDKYFQESE